MESLGSTEELKNLINKRVSIQLRRGHYKVEGILDKVDQNKKLHLSQCKRFFPQNAVVEVDKMVYFAHEYDQIVQISSAATSSCDVAKTAEALSSSASESAASLSDEYIKAEDFSDESTHAPVRSTLAQATAISNPEEILEQLKMIRVAPTEVGRKPQAAAEEPQITRSVLTEDGPIPKDVPKQLNMIRVVPTTNARLVLPQTWATLQSAMAEKSCSRDERTNKLAVEIAEYCEEIFPTSHLQGLVPTSKYQEVDPRPFPICVILARHGFNGVSALKAGRLLAIRNWQVYLYICAPLELLVEPSPNKDFEIQLAPFISAKGHIVGSTCKLPIPHLVIEAIFDMPNRIRQRGTWVNVEAVFASNWLQDLARWRIPYGLSVLSIDIASFVEYDTGSTMEDLLTLDSEGFPCLTHFPPAPTTHLICGSVLPRGCLYWKNCPRKIHLVDIGYSRNCLTKAAYNTTDNDHLRLFFSRSLKGVPTSDINDGKPQPIYWISNEITYYGNLSMIEEYGLAVWGRHPKAVVKLR